MTVAPTTNDVPAGHRRAWFQCRRCGATEAKTVRKFQIGGPIMRLACGHGDGAAFFENAEPIDPPRKPARGRGPRSAAQLGVSAGLVQLRRARSTKRWIGVYNSADAGLDDDDGRGPWSTVCEDHGHIVSHGTRATAIAHAAAPEGWCERCMAMLERLVDRRAGAGR